MDCRRQSSRLSMHSIASGAATTVWIENPVSPTTTTVAPLFVKARVVPNVHDVLPATTVHVQGAVDGTPFALHLPADRVWPADARDGVVDDLVDLTHVNNANILDALHVRFDANQTFTHVDNVLFAMNPWTDPTERYLRVDGETCSVPTALHAQANKPLVAMLTDALAKMNHGGAGGNGHHHSILMMGNSGSGKSYTANTLLQALMEASLNKRHGRLTEDGVKGVDARAVAVETKLLAAMTVLDAFGNARTRGNPNSSRFGRVVTVQLNAQDVVVSASVQCFQLESSDGDPSCGSLGIAHRGRYHILELLKQVPPRPGRPDGQDPAPTLDAIHRVGHIKDAMTAAGVPPRTMESILKVAHAVAMLLPSPQATGAPDGRDEDALHRADEILGVRAGTLHDAMKAKELSIAQVGRVLYRTALRYVLAAINGALDPCSGRPSTKILDIVDMPGFESLAQANVFETFCINYADEKLRQFFIQYMFKLELRIYATEALAAVPHLPFQDNQHVVELLDAKAGGILHMLETTSTGLDRDGATFAEAVANRYHTHASFQADDARHCFAIHHSTETVMYTASDFVRVKADVDAALMRPLRASMDPGIAAMFGHSAAAPPQTPSPQLQSGRNVEMDHLLLSLCKSEPHFIQCIKSNAAMQPCVFDDSVVLQQLKRLDVTSTLLLRKHGFTHRATFADFLDQYKCIEAYTSPRLMATERSLTPKRRCDLFLNRLWVHPALVHVHKADAMQLGLRFIFFKRDAIDAIDAIRAQTLKELDTHVGRIQKRWHRARTQARMANLADHARIIQRQWTRHVKHVVHRKQCRAATVIQTAFRGWRIRPQDARLFRRDRTHLESSIRHRLHARNDVVLTRRVSRLQAVVRRYLARRRASRQEGIARAIQRGGLALQLQSQVAAARHAAAQKLQSIFRGAKIRAELGTVLHILALKRSIRLEFAAATMIQAWVRTRSCQRRYNAILRASSLLQAWMRHMHVRIRTRQAAAAAGSIQAAARGFLVRHEASEDALQHILGNLEQATAVEMGLELVEMVQHNRRVIDLRPPPRASRHTILALHTRPGDAKRHRHSTWSAQFSALQDMLVERGRTLAAFDIGESHAAALTDLGHVYTYGWNDRGQLGTRTVDSKPRFHPKGIPPSFFHNAVIAAIATGEDHTVALTDAGIVYTWGGNRFGQLGLGHFQTCHAPQRVTNAVGVMGPHLRKAIAIATGSYHSLALVETGSIMAWGATTPDEAMSTQTALPKLLKADPPAKFTALACGTSFSVAVCER
ncbi:hypothetical protein, variant [Aphanomyces invadans]|uniref:Myosin motor domain-containing protein n=1 Tax=Aphanomyces invadans TaxID=157072 RepID=A0A024TL54_9STRA|nr:hypothetical protein, variant [Aphanomyces invadans]ETV94865.1 hypothetical protein, variant [Aphanomyces invadans]|eukprot:XP_008876456.1 hypothetical protein, variant [Aphanomyces invadans]